MFRKRHTTLSRTMSPHPLRPPAIRLPEHGRNCPTWDPQCWSRRPPNRKLGQNVVGFTEFTVAAAGSAVWRAAGSATASARRRGRTAGPRSNGLKAGLEPRTATGRRKARARSLFLSASELHSRESRSPDQSQRLWVQRRGNANSMNGHLRPWPGRLHVRKRLLDPGAGNISL